MSVRLSGWHHCVDALNVRRIDVTGTTQLTLVFGGLFGQDVALESHTRFNGTTWTHAKTLFRGALGFHFWHNASALSDSSKVTGLQVATTMSRLGACFHLSMQQPCRLLHFAHGKVRKFNTNSGIR
jgi:hypothetical protein